MKPLVKLFLILALLCVAFTRSDFAGVPFRLSKALVDFNGDGFGDMAVGVSKEDVGAISNAGAVNVIYGSGAGLSAIDNQLWHRNVPDVKGVAEEDDFFGWATAAGDFNGDRFTDLAIGVAGDDVDGAVDAGSVNVLYGSAGGLTAHGNQLWTQNASAILDTAEEDDLFGYTLTVGDFNGDGFDDLAIGIGGESLDEITAAGAVSILYGSATGLSATNNQFWHQNSPGILDEAELNDQLGFAGLTAGDFDGNGFDDLAVGVYLEDIDGGTNTGAVNVLFGSTIGLTAAGNQFFHQNTPGIPGEAADSDWFGFALASGDFNRDGFADLAIGIPLKEVGAVDDAGAVTIIYGSAIGPLAAGSQIWTQNTPTIFDEAEDSDWFGYAITVDDFNGDKFQDLAVGVAAEDIDGAEDAGAANVIFGMAAGLGGVGNQFWHLNIAEVRGVAEPGDNLGVAIGSNNFNGDAFSELSLGAVNKDVAGNPDAGTVSVLHGSGNGLTSAGNQLWHQDVPGIQGVAENGDQFGKGLH